MTTPEGVSGGRRVRPWAREGKRGWGSPDEGIAILRGKEERVVREDFLEGRLFELGPSLMKRSLCQAEGTACVKAQRHGCMYCVWRTPSTASV